MRPPALSLRVATLLALIIPAVAALADSPSCRATSGRTALHVVELYTSEGCSSCPPADRWLSGLAGRDDVLAQAFHVDYWDHLGWKDRFSSAAYTARQEQQRAASGARFIYTPQVIVDGIDRREIASPRAQALVELALAREADGKGFVATVTPLAGAPERLAAYWSVTESGHRTAVRAGENAGATLHHDFVVREYRPVAAWSSRGAAERLQFSPSGGADGTHPRQVNLVIVDAATGRPLQGLRLGC